MTLRISGKSISVGEALRGRVSERTEEVLANISMAIIPAISRSRKDGFGFRTDCCAAP